MIGDFGFTVIDHRVIAVTCVGLAVSGGERSDGSAESHMLIARSRCADRGLLGDIDVLAVEKASWDLALRLSQLASA